MHKELTTQLKYVLTISTSGIKSIYQPFTLTMSIVLTPFVGLPHTHCRYVQHAHRTYKAYAHMQTTVTMLHTATNKQNQTSKPNITTPSGDACHHAWPSPSGQKISQGSGSIGQMHRRFPGGLKQAIPYPFNKAFINPHMTTTHPAVIQYPF